MTTVIVDGVTYMSETRASKFGPCTGCAALQDMDLCMDLPACETVIWVKAPEWVEMTPTELQNLLEMLNKRPSSRIFVSPQGDTYKVKL
jgi:hypothetical protein